IVIRPEFKTVTVPTFNFDGPADVVSRSYESVAAKAEELAKAHFAKHRGSKTERWVAEGMGHEPDDECPFCGQETRELELLKAYKAYFDSSYSEYLKRVSGIRESVLNRLGDAQLTSWIVAYEFNQGLHSVWAESLELKEIPTLDIAKAAGILKAAKAELLKLVEAKERNPLDAFDPAPFSNVLAKLNTVVSMAQSYNAVMAKLNEQAADYKAKFARADVAALTAKRSELLIRKNRYDAKTIHMLNAVLDARAGYKRAEMAKEAARAEVDKQIGRATWRDRG